MKHQTPSLRKFKRLARRLSLRTYETVGLLETLWIATQINCPRGDIGKLDNESIAIELDWPGDPHELVDALVDADWLDRCVDNRLVVHAWPEHAPRYIHGIVSKKGGFAIPRMVDSTVVADCSTPLQYPTTVDDCTKGQPNLTKPNLTILPSEVSAERCSTPPSEFSFEVKRSKGHQDPEWLLPQHELDRYVATYGDHLDVPTQLRKAATWLHTHPTKRKTAGGMLGFLTRWFNRASDRPSSTDPKDLSEFHAARTPEAVKNIRF